MKARILALHKLGAVKINVGLYEMNRSLGIIGNINKAAVGISRSVARNRW